MYKVIRCPYCGQSDGNDDSVVASQYYKTGDTVELELVKECDICHKKYIVLQTYKLEYEELEFLEVNENDI